MRKHHLRASRLAVLALLAAPIATLASATHVAAAAGQTVQWDGANMIAYLTKQSAIVGCNAAGVVVFNNVATVPSVECRFIQTLSVSLDAGNGAFSIDFRPVSKTQFIALASTSGGIANGGTYYGSAISDYVFVGAGSVAFGFGGRDTIYAQAAGAQAWGGDGADHLAGFDQSAAQFEGGAGDDYIQDTGHATSIAGGPGNDTITSSFGQTNIFGGPGNDKIYTRVDPTGVRRLVDSGSGADFVECLPTLSVDVFKAETIPDPQGLIRITDGALGSIDIEQTEAVATRSSAARTFDIAMDALTAFKVTARPRAGYFLTVRAPSTNWTNALGAVTSPGVQPVTYVNFPATAVTVLPAH